MFRVGSRGLTLFKGNELETYPLIEELSHNFVGMIVMRMRNWKQWLCKILFGVGCVPFTQTTLVGWEKTLEILLFEEESDYEDEICNRTEWSSIRSVIIRVINNPNWTTRSSVTNES